MSMTSATDVQAQPQQCTIDVTRFRAWLSQQSAEDVGIASSQHSCPIARFVGEQLGRLVYVTRRQINIGNEWLDYDPDAAQWVPCFVTRVDLLGFGIAVSRQDALEILQEIGA